jgi:hypothetical protein
MFLACESHQDEYQPTPIDLATEETTIQDAILTTQQLLIGKLLAHVDSSDLTPAVRFCAENAQRLTDSISNELGYSIKRISPMNRNDLNAVTKADLDAYKFFEKSKTSGQLAKSHFDALNQTYYAPIVLGMPLCLQCHGTKKDRNPDAYALIEELYPKDRAVDYSLGDLRAVWKVKKK